jgi:hypothetical protein
MCISGTHGHRTGAQADVGWWRGHGKGESPLVDTSPDSIRGEMSLRSSQSKEWHAHGKWLSPVSTTFA